MGHDNLLFIMTDQQRFDTLGVYGNLQIRTPNLDRFASQATVFERAYCTQPVCSPARATLMTGTWPHANGVTNLTERLRPGLPTIFERIERGSYRKAYFGRWGIPESMPAPHRCDVCEIFDWPPEELLRRAGLEPVDGRRFAKPDLPYLPEGLSGPAYLSDRVCDFLKQDAEKPFVAFASIYRPHPPYSSAFDGMYDPAGIELPDNFDAVPTVTQHPRSFLESLYLQNRGHGHDDLTNEVGWRDVMARYWGLCSLVDKHIGRIFEQLEHSGLADKTIIVFTSDHGDMMGSHRLLGKGVMFEESIRVPLIIRLPGQMEGRRISTPVSHIDLLPTLLDLLGQSAGDDLPDRSLRPYLEDSGGTVNTPDDVFVEWQGFNHLVGQALGIRRGGVEQLTPEDRNRETIADFVAEHMSREEAIRGLTDTIRTVLTPDGWKLNRSAGGFDELYDLNEDPGETRNLAEDPHYRGRVADLTARLHRWQAASADPHFISR